MPLLKLTDGQAKVSSDQEPVWKTLEEWQAGDALELTVDAEPETAHLSASAIAIRFPAFNDGRGLSLAVLLRQRFGYEGELFAIGEVQEDILHYMRRCGFDAFVLADDTDIDIALAQMKPYTGHYQGSVIDPQPRFAR